MSRFSTSVARSALTSRMRPSRSAASGCRIWFRIVARASASALFGSTRQHEGKKKEDSSSKVRARERKEERGGGEPWMCRSGVVRSIGGSGARDTRPSLPLPPPPSSLPIRLGAPRCPFALAPRDHPIPHAPLLVLVLSPTHNDGHATRCKRRKEPLTAATLPVLVPAGRLGRRRLVPRFAP